MKRFFLILFFVVSAFLFAAAYKEVFYKQETQTKRINPVTVSDTLTLVAVGDMMLGTNYPNTSYLPPDDGKMLLQPVASILQSADVTFGNCEGTFLDGGGTVKQCNDPSKCYAFRQPTHYAKYLAEAGFDLISVANNHMGDFGDEGRSSSMKTLTASGIKFAGQLSCPTTIFEKDGVKYGLAAFAPNTGCVDLRDITAAKKIVSELAKQCDVCLISFHGGAEGAQNKHVNRKTEKYLGENRGNIYSFSHEMIDAGADVMLGHGPHITRAIELYKDRFIAYSMGNFCTYARFNLDGAAGFAPIIKLKLDKEGKFLDGQIIPIKQEGEGGPQLDDKKKAIIEIISLTNSDFPETKLSISAQTGMITRN